ncbi:MAG: selenide, water dikinase SelD [Deltaproteobacteria bacterium]|nr:selenide, water dikinase SelD [Deltaproteobacteria bacterium]MBT4643867.1 selenide, water dikinase SelD [Deltaproteobacteria bacterium]MBT6615945.1 selenide, water dikinase SelD [Deltaproteobacteria bacterium]MBT7154051.1 selenide, water dikinase SelD [Deltaproteobacteria bacterium]MBT7714829.1 selenide, water dikinase SelD [Deltaproteobacteria bacterium]
MSKLLDSLPKNSDPNLLVGFQTSDDAAVYKISDDSALVTTADFITPPVNDPYVFGQIAAANSLSDIYAMGGRPLTCLNLVCFPPDKLEADVLNQIVAGALQKITEAGAVLAGGHTVEDDEPKFGLSVTGLVHPDKYWANSGARIGDLLILTKPVGSGVLFNANLKNWVSEKAMAECIETICDLNDRVVTVAQNFTVHGATDVTGFGLAGHGYEVAKASNVCLEIEVNKIPMMSEALEMYKKGMNTGVNAFNQDLVAGKHRFVIELPEWHREIVFDPQTSGGLLLSVPEEQAQDFCRELIQVGYPNTSIIGRVTPKQEPYYLVFT